MESYSLHTAQLWAHARLKMKSLGVLCGLMPRDSPTSEQIHLVVNILAGLGDDPRAGALPILYFLKTGTNIRHDHKI